MKGDIGMANYEKQVEQEAAYIPHLDFLYFRLTSPRDDCSVSLKIGYCTTERL